MSTYGAEFQLSTMTGQDGVKIIGEEMAYGAGSSVSAAGDVNGDGFDDIIVGAQYADLNGTVSGAAYVVFGRSGGFGASLDLATLNGVNGFRTIGETASAYAGTSVAAAGDLNGDGFDDVIIGADPVTANSVETGAAYVIFGNEGAFDQTVSLSGLDGMNGFQIGGGEEGEFGGYEVSAAGDINSDGIQDVIIAGSYYDEQKDDYFGTAYIVFGNEGGFASDLVLSSLSGSNGFRVIGNTADDLYVISVSGAGDVNGDGIDDLVIGAPYAKTEGGKTGAAYVIFGNASGFSASVSLSSLNGKNGFQISGENGWDRVGWSVSAAGDVNGDGIGDIIIGAWGASLGGKEAGGAYVVFGKAGGFGGNLNLSALNGKNGFQINGESPGDRAGWSVSAAGDINGDGYGDLIVGGPQDVGVDGTGAAWVLFGKAEDFDSSIDLSELDGNNGFRIGREDEYDAAGTSVSAAGDINGDGFDDLIVGADLAGTAYVIYGKQTAPTSGADTLTGASGNETITGLGGDDLLSGMTGNDSLAGNDDDDRLDGGGGKDLLDGGSGADRLTGGKGDDTYVTDGADKIIEKSNEGTDTVRSSASVTLVANVEHLVLTGSGAINGTGNSAANSLTGNSGANSLNGGGGSDTLAGGKASDILTGGGGSDTFVFDTKPGSSNIDRITDYNVAADTMRIDNAVFSGLANGGLKASAFVKNTSGNAADGSDRIIYESDTGKVYFDKDGTGSAAKVHFATLGTNLALTSADFIVF